MSQQPVLSAFAQFLLVSTHHRQMLRAVLANNHRKLDAQKTLEKHECVIKGFSVTLNETGLG